MWPLLPDPKVPSQVPLINGELGSKPSLFLAQICTTDLETLKPKLQGQVPPVPCKEPLLGPMDAEIVSLCQGVCGQLALVLEREKHL